MRAREISRIVIITTAPTSTRTFLVHDGTDNLDRFGAAGGIAFAAAGWSKLLYILALAIMRIKKKRENSKR